MPNSQPESQYINLLSKRWRSLTYNWDILSSYGDDSKLYCLTDFQAAWLLSNTEYLRWSSRWENCPCSVEDLDAMKAELDYNLMNCFDTRWMGQLDYVYNEAQAAQLQVLTDAYDLGGISGINADTPTDYYNGDDSPDRIDALCMACDTYVRSYLNQFLTKAAIFVGLISILGIFVASTPIIGLIAGVIVGGFAYMTQVAVDACNDSDAVSDVVCCMFNGLYGQAVNQSNFISSLDACGFEIGSNAAILRDLVASDLSQDKNWYSFLNALGNSWLYLNAGADFDCDCVPVDTWSHYFDFEVSNGGFVRVTTGVGSGTAGVWTSGVGWVATNTFYPSSTYRKIVYLQKTFTPTVITKILVTYDLTKGTWVNPAEFIIADRATGLPNADLTYAASVNGNAQTIELNGSANLSSFTLRHLSSLNNVNSYSGSAVIKSVYIEGEGVDPF